MSSLNILINVCFSSYVGLIVVNRLLHIINPIRPDRISELIKVYFGILQKWYHQQQQQQSSQQYERLLELSDIELTNNVMILNKNEDIIIIWFDDNIDQEMKQHLTELHDHIIVSYTKDELIHSIDQIQNYKIILIVSGQYSRDTLQLLHNNTKIDSFYIFCINKQLYEDLILQYSKLIGIYTEYEQLLEILKQQIYLLLKHLSIFSLFNMQNKSVRNLETESIPYLWYQLLRDTLLNTDIHE
ncbi:unnamed protein product [Didymodactylos carnosus]|uniref:Uncharacterized protein n=1 Tax=Didymodactylos carnosus TaxID=1234261 RepID=A0A8S2QT87_9BILA|nr:unnamed protein product [Didymodactylos carnosus]CAF4124461.1 unnamed protein product [Didymodactylos carnosus]